MYSTVEINKNNKKTLVTIKPRKSIIYKITLFIMSIFILLLLIGVGLLFFAERIEFNLEAFLMIVVSIILLIFVYKHLRAAFRQEIIVIENKKLIYNNSFLGLGQYFEVDLNKIKSFKYIGYGQQTKHPLDIKVDGLGFGTQQGEIDYLNEKGTMILVTEYKVLKFGSDVGEEDYFKIKHLVD